MDAKTNDEVCFCVSLRLAALVILWLNTVGGLSGFLAAIVFVYDDHYQLNHGSVFYLILYDQIAWVLFSFFALYGALVKEPTALKPLIGLWIIRLFVYCLAILGITISLINGSTYVAETVGFVSRRIFYEIIYEWQTGLATLLGLLISFFLGLYMTLIIHSYCNVLQEEKYDEYRRLISEEISHNANAPRSAEYFNPPSYYQAINSDPYISFQQQA